jgi:hypothetical protein
MLTKRFRGDCMSISSIFSHGAHLAEEASRRRLLGVFASTPGVRGNNAVHGWGPRLLSVRHGLYEAQSGLTHYLLRSGVRTRSPIFAGARVACGVQP